VFDLAPRGVGRERVLDGALDLALAQEFFERLLYPVGDAAGLGRGAVEGRELAADGREQLVVGEPDEVVERDGHRPLPLDDLEGQESLVGRPLDLVAEVGEEAGLQQAVGGRLDGVYIHALADLQAALLQRLRLFDAVESLELYLVELEGLSGRRLCARVRGGEQQQTRGDEQRGGHTINTMRY
jgi:hypothetical protein